VGAKGELRQRRATTGKTNNLLGAKGGKTGAERNRNSNGDHESKNSRKKKGSKTGGGKGEGGVGKEVVCAPQMSKGKSRWNFRGETNKKRGNEKSKGRTETNWSPGRKGRNTTEEDR